MLEWIRGLLTELGVLDPVEEYNRGKAACKDSGRREEGLD